MKLKYVLFTTWQMTLCISVSEEPIASIFKVEVICINWDRRFITIFGNNGNRTKILIDPHDGDEVGIRNIR
jgi:hypothetical protein